MPYVFDRAQADRRLASTMATYWTNFAKTGNPNGAGLPVWPTFTESSPQGMLLGQEPRSGKPFDEQALARIDSAYATVRASAARK